jgi:hypothetical protein
MRTWCVNPVSGAAAHVFLEPFHPKERNMRTVLLGALAAFAATPALAVGRLADVAIIDRDTGQRLTVHHHEGEYWVAGRPGAHYAIQIDSRHGRRLLAVTSVDGVNILTGESAGHLQRGYVFAPWQGYSVAGWRKSDSQIAAFTFTSIPKSYAARTGRPQNVGVIGVALFPEKPPQYVPPPVPPVSSFRQEAPAADASQELEEAQVTGARVHGSGAQDARSSVERRERAAPAPAPSLGTGHGRREHSVVVQVPFERESPTPAEIIRIRYDSHDNLVAMGIIHRTPPRPRPLDPFPESRLGYVPDP